MQKRILIVRTDRLGDTVMITPMLREIKKAFPDAFVGTLTQPQNSQVFINNPNVDTIITDNLAKDTFRQVVKEIRKHKFNYALLPLPTERAAYQVFLAGIKSRIGSGHKLYQQITFMRNISRNKYNPIRHEADYCMDLARAIGVKTDNLTPEIFVTETERTQAYEFLRQFGIQPGDAKIIVHTGSGGSDANWAESKYLSLIKKLLASYPQAKLLLTAREMSGQFRENIKELKTDNVIDLMQCFPQLRDFIKVISVCNLLISSSTGPMHVASALGVKTVSIFCHRRMSRPARWGALGPNAINIEVPEKFCDTYCSADKERCEINAGISVGDVMKAVRRQL